MPPDEQAVRLRAIVHGRVQGVGFREFVSRRAHSLRLSGYARNLADGRSVEAVAEGPRCDVERLLGYLRAGPRMADVEGVEAEWGEASGEFSGFRAG